jgi:hypothetical protein
MRWPEFKDGETIIGFNLIDFLEWVEASLSSDECSPPPKDMPRFAFPPVQREVVWRPKQALDLWDSVMRGLPIGTFYLLVRSSEQPDSVNFQGLDVPKGAGFDLLDGQQRVRALLLGLRDTFDDRCLWIDLGGKKPLLRLTSKAQPFGYRVEDGGKLYNYQRGNARENIEPENHPILNDGDDGNSRHAYDLELFADNVKQDGERLSPQPPKPYDASEETFKFHELFSNWSKAVDGDAKIVALSVHAPKAGNEVIEALNLQFNNVQHAQIGLLRVCGAQDEPNNILALYERIGAGGTPLTPEERLYSIYKHHVPPIRAVVDEIFKKVGHVLPPTKITTTALRIANANKNKPAYSVPDVAVFSKEMAANPLSELRRKLDDLLPVRKADGRLFQSFATVKNVLAHSGIPSFSRDSKKPEFGIPQAAVGRISRLGD